METYRISDELLREAVKRTCEQEGAYYDELTQNAGHHFSLHHRVRMHQIYRQLKKTEERKSAQHYETVYPSRLRPRYLLIVVLLMIAMSMTTLALEPIREGAYELVEKCFPDHTDISFKKMEDEVAKQKKEIKEFKPQKLDYVPMGYVMEGEVLWSSIFVTLRSNFCHRVYATPIACLIRRFAIVIRMQTYMIILNIHTDSYEEKKANYEVERELGCTRIFRGFKWKIWCFVKSLYNGYDSRCIFIRSIIGKRIEKI